MPSADFLELLQEMTLLASIRRPDRKFVGDFCGEEKGKACKRKDEAQSAWRGVTCEERSFRSLWVESLPDRGPSGIEHLAACPFSGRWKSFWSDKKVEEAFQQTALLRCWLSRDQNRRRLFAANIAILAAGFAFLDQAENQVVYSTGQHGLIYLPFYRISEDASKSDFERPELDPLDRLKHDILAATRVTTEYPNYVKILNQTDSETRSQFESENGFIFAPDGEISCFALNNFFREVAIQLNGERPFSSEEVLVQWITTHYAKTTVSLLADKGRNEGSQIQRLLTGKHPFPRESYARSHRFSNASDYEYATSIGEDEELTRDFPVDLNSLRDASLKFTLHQYLRYLGLLDTETRGTSRLKSLVSWVNGYLSSSHSDNCFCVPAIKDLCSDGERQQIELVNGNVAMTVAELAALISKLAFAFGFSCSSRTTDATNEIVSRKDRWAKATRTTFLGHTFARAGSTVPSCWFALPIQAERGSQTTRELPRHPLQEVGFLLSLLDASVRTSNDKPFSFDPFSPVWDENGNAARCRASEIQQELTKIKTVGHLLGKVESDKVYWLEIIRHQTDKQARKTAIAAISAQSLSHNIGSHALSDSKLFLVNDPDGKGIKDFHQYLQGRMDYVAQLIAEQPAQPEPMYLKDLLCGFFRQRLLLNRLVADRGFSGPKISFNVVIPAANRKDEERTELNWNEHIEPFSKEILIGGPSDGTKRSTKPLVLKGEDVLVAIPGGWVGRHALFSVLENVMRNSVKYGQKERFDEVSKTRKRPERLEVTFRLRDPGDKEDYWLLELWDNLSGFTVAQEGDEQGEAKGAYAKLCADFEQDVIGDQGKPRPGGHGLVEIKEAMRFLHPHEDSPKRDGTGVFSPWACAAAPHNASLSHKDDCPTTADDCYHANVANMWESTYDSDGKIGTLVYRIRLRRPRLLGVWCPGAELGEGRRQSSANGIFFRKEDSLADPSPDGSPSLAELAPYLLVVRDSENVDPDKIADELASEHWRLPFRIMVVVGDQERVQKWLGVLTVHERSAPATLEEAQNKKRNFLPANRVRVITDKELFTLIDPLTDAKMDMALVNRVYDCWLTAYKPLNKDQQWHLAVCFDRDKATVCEAWEQADLHAFNAKAATVSVYSFVPKPKDIDPRDPPTYGVLHCQGTVLNATQHPASCLIHFGNHGKIPKDYIETFNNHTLRFTQAFGSSEAPRTFNSLYAPPKDKEAFKFFIFALLEAALTDIAVLDERTLGSLLEPGSSKLSNTRIRDGEDARVQILVQAPGFDQTLRARARDDLEWGPKFDPDNQEDVFLACIPSVEDPPVIGPLDKSAGDVLLLHEGLIEELVSRGRFKTNSELTYFRRFSRIVRMSGKGPEPRKLDSRLPFSEYSAISTSIIPYEKDGRRLGIEKLNLARALICAIGHGETKETR